MPAIDAYPRLVLAWSHPPLEVAREWLKVGPLASGWTSDGEDQNHLSSERASASRLKSPLYTTLVPILASWLLGNFDRPG